MRAVRGCARRRDSGVIRQLLYRSGQLHEFTGRDMTRLLQQSRARNARCGIGGMLLWHDGLFMQLLEGPIAAVDALYARIALDRRHCEVRLVSRVQRPRSLLAGWPMAWAEAPPPDELPVPAFTELDNDRRALAALERAGADPVAATMRAFLRGEAVAGGGLMPVTAGSAS